MEEYLWDKFGGNQEAYNWALGRGAFAERRDADGQIWVERKHYVATESHGTKQVDTFAGHTYIYIYTYMKILLVH